MDGDQWGWYSSKVLHVTNETLGADGREKSQEGRTFNFPSSSVFASPNRQNNGQENQYPN
jgi:hypothetical protein